MAQDLPEAGVGLSDLVKRRAEPRADRPGPRRALHKVVARRRRRDADAASTRSVLGLLRPHDQLEIPAGALQVEAEVLAGVYEDELGEIRPLVHGPAVDRDDAVAF